MSTLRLETVARPDVSAMLKRFVGRVPDCGPADVELSTAGFDRRAHRMLL